MGNKLKGKDKPKDLDQSLIEKAADLILNSKFLVVMTGAGVSTESGIPDFRSPETGLWTKITAKEMGRILTHAPTFWKVVRELGPGLLNAKPNSSHIIIHKLEEMKIVKGLITQNIDGLHQMAGSPFVMELHGNATEFRCIYCHGYFDARKIIKKHKKKDDNIPPSCPQCGAELILNVKLFGQAIDRGPWLESVSWAQKADVMLIIGSSLEVAPANQLPTYTLKHGGKLIIINRTDTELDDFAEVVIHNSAGIVMEAIYKNIQTKLGNKNIKVKKFN